MKDYAVYSPIGNLHIQQRKDEQALATQSHIESTDLEFCSFFQANF